jgi:hypothetical protein
VIGVAAPSIELRMAEEFFELFKTPWEPAVPGRKYRVVLSTDGVLDDLDADLFLVYGSNELAVDREAGVAVTPAGGTVEIDWKGTTLPVYGGAAVFDARSAGPALTCSRGTVSYCRRGDTRVVRRIGYDLFREIACLLTDGQPVARAATPTLELHIDLLRQLLLDSGVSFVEIPPRPHGFDFVCCLTHDIDFFGIRRHTFDRTLAGFMLRASVGTLIDVVRGRRPVAEAVRNWTALASLPLVFLGLAPDFWHPFEDYARAERGRQSTFFLVPFKGRPGLAPNSTSDSARAVSYEVAEIQDEVRKAAVQAHELAVHGIDAWRDVEAGRAEMKQLTAITGGETAGVRMHWLYFDHDSPLRLEAAGFDYDSTCGYNDAVGFRAGTSQVFRLPGTENLMELPLSIMDSALFFRWRMSLTRSEAAARCSHVVSTARRFGGTVVVNWHDRSLAPERLWGAFYQELLGELGKDNLAWFTTAGQAVDWFRWRRSIRFTEDTRSGTVTIAGLVPPSSLPSALVCVRRPANHPLGPSPEVPFDGRSRVEFAL